MAFDSGVFKTRALTATIFTVVMLAGLLSNRWSFIILFTIIHFGCWYELLHLIKKIYGNSGFTKIILGVFYITLPTVLIIVIRVLPLEGKGDDFLKILPIGIIASLWINDTMAYIVGSFIGKNPLTKISPKKTWEGTLGGIILCVLAITIAGNTFGHYEWYHWLFISLISAIAGTFGDLLESKLKRMANVKDSGAIMPGHGGFLDRFDSLLVAIPFVFTYYFLFMR